jgi:hypothetical protein
LQRNRHDYCKSVSQITTSEISDIVINIHAPDPARVDWLCRYDIGWPERKVERHGAGIDAVRGMMHALKMIGAELYTSDHHRSGRLEWLAL